MISKVTSPNVEGYKPFSGLDPDVSNISDRSTELKGIQVSLKLVGFRLNIIKLHLTDFPGLH